MRVMRYLPSAPAVVLGIATALFALCACGPDQMDGDPARPGETAPEEADVDPAGPANGNTRGAQRHVVTFRYGADVSPERIAAITRRFAALRDSVPGVTAFEHGVNNSPEGLNKDITHVYLLTFEDAAARDAYLPHPAHQRFVELLDGAVDDVFVIDYVVE